MSTDRQALSGLTVLDFSQGVAGPHATLLLALQGANVIKIEPLEGDWGRRLGNISGDQCAHSVAFNRGKRSVALNLKNPLALEAAKRIATRADIVVESFRSGVIDRLGFGYEAMRRINPQIVFASITGFGQSGPERNRPTVDGLIQAFTGVMGMNRTPDGMPHRIGMAAVDVLTGLYAFQAIASAVLRQVRFSEGSRLDISMMEAAAAFQGCKLMESAWSEGEPPALYAPAGTLETRDGHIVISVMRQDHFREIMMLVGRGDLADDLRLQTHEGRLEHGSLIMAALGKAMTSRSSDEWISRLQDKGILCEKVNRYEDYLAHPHVAETGAIDWMQQGSLQQLPIANVPGAPQARNDSRLRHAPGIGEDTVSILQDAGYAAAEIVALKDAGAIK